MVELAEWGELTVSGNVARGRLATHQMHCPKEEMRHNKIRNIEHLAEQNITASSLIYWYHSCSHLSPVTITLNSAWAASLSTSPRLRSACCRGHLHAQKTTSRLAPHANCTVRRSKWNHFFKSTSSSTKPGMHIKPDTVFANEHPTNAGKERDVIRIRVHTRSQDMNLILQ